MATVGHERATIDDLYVEDGKAELIGGRIIQQMATDFTANRVALRISFDLMRHELQNGGGFAGGDGLGFVVPELSSGRESFAPDAAFRLGPLPRDRRRFVSGPPTLAVEVRSEGDYGPSAERAMAAKRADYFEAGTLVVWDVDPDGRVIRSHRGAGQAPTVFAAGEVAHAEPAVPGWEIAVDEVFA